MHAGAMAEASHQAMLGELSEIGQNDLLLQCCLNCRSRPEVGCHAIMSRVCLYLSDEVCKLQKSSIHAS